MLHNDIALGRLHVPIHWSATVIAGLVNNYYDRPTRIAAKILEKLHEPRTSHPSFERGKFHISSWAHRADQLHTKAIAAIHYNRGLANFGPSRPSVRIR